jgi:hypothetical protein
MLVYSRIQFSDDFGNGVLEDWIKVDRCFQIYFGKKVMNQALKNGERQR